jgi:hypothetical protein
VKKLFLSLCFLLLIITGIFAWEFTPALDLNANIAYPYTSVDEELQKKLSGAVDAAGSFMVNTDLLPQLWFIPTVTLNYASTAQPLNIDDERFLFSQWLDAYISYGVNYEINPGAWELRLRGFYRKDFSQQTQDEVVGKGLYDYADKGFYFENINIFDIGDMGNEIAAGFKYTDRRFPNYSTLISDPDVQELIGNNSNPNTYTKEKDSLSYNIYASDNIKWGSSNWFTNFEFSYEYTPYTEQKIIYLDGVLSDERRVDKYSRLTLEIPYYADDYSGVSFGYGLTVKLTNQNYYDQLGTTEPEDDKYIKNYYNYMGHTLNFTIHYGIPDLLFKGQTTTAVIALMVEAVNYNTRYAKDLEGLYKPDLQKDNNYTVSLDLKHLIFEWWEVSAKASFTDYNSNMQYETFGLYNYSYFTAGIGSSVSF